MKPHSVMRGLDPRIHVFARGDEVVDGRDKPGHDDLLFRERRVLVERRATLVAARSGTSNSTRSMPASR